MLGVANGTSKILGLVNFSSDLDILTAFAKSLEVSFIVHLLQSSMFGLNLGFSNKGLGSSSVSLGFYHLPPLMFLVRGVATCTHIRTCVPENIEN